MTTTFAKTAVLTTVASFALAFTGCNKDKATTDDADAGETGHEGHNHAAAEAAETGHEGHDHAAAEGSEPVPMAPQAPQSKTIVTVNGKALMRTELMKEMALFAASPQFASLPPQQAAMMRQQMESRFVNRFVDQTILTAEADKQAEKVTDADIDKMIEEIRGSLQPGTTLEGILKERSMTIEKLRTDIGEDLHIRKLLEKQAEKVPAATDAEVAAFYEENKARFAAGESVHARHILLKLDPAADDAAKAAAKAEIEGYRKQLADGSADFAKLAAEHSDCPSGKRSGGDLGTFPRGQMVPAFDTAAFAQDVDTIGPVIETDFGYHIIQVLKKVPAGETSFEDVKEEISERLSGQGKQAAVEAYLAALREKATITYGDQ